MCGKSEWYERAGSAPGQKMLFEQEPGAAADIPIAANQAPPAEGLEQAFFSGMIGTQLEKVGALLRRAGLERRQQAVRVSLMPLAWQYPDFDY